MAFKQGERRVPRLALNAVRIAMPAGTIPAAMVPYERDALHGFLDRDPQDVHPLRMGDRLAVVPLTSGADLPASRLGLKATEHPNLVAALAREAVLRELLTRADKGYRVTRRRPLIVESGGSGRENVLPDDLGLPEWLKKRLVLEFDVRPLVRRGTVQVVLTCSHRLRTFIDASVAELRELGVPLVGKTVSTVREASDPRISDRLGYAGRILAVDDVGIITLADHEEGQDSVPDAELYLEPSRANFIAVVTALTQGRADDVLKRVADTEAKWHGGAVTFDTVRKAIAWLTQCDALHLADGVPLRFDGPFDQTVDGPAFPRVESFYKPRLQFDPGGASNMSWAQKGLEEVGPYDRESFARKKLRIAVVCEAGYRRSMEAAVHGLLKGLPHIRSSGPNSLAPHPTGLVGRFRLEEPEVRFFPAEGNGGTDYADAARAANADAAGRDERWDLALLQVSREWQDRPYDDSPYWMGKAAFLKQGTVVQALSVETVQMEDFPYACALANVALGTYAKLGGRPWLLQAPPGNAHEFVFGLGSHVEKQGRRGAGQRVVGIATMFTAQGTYLLDSRTSAVGYEGLPAALRDVVVEAVTRVRSDEAWRPNDPVRLVFHAFTQLGRETADAVVEAVRGLGLARMDFAFLHVVEEHPFTVFDLEARTDTKAAFAPERGQAVELSDLEWLVTLTGRKEVKGERQGLPDPVLLRLHHLSTYRNMYALSRQVSDFACHSWRTFTPSRLPVSLGYADQIARQLSGLERTPNWDGDAVMGNPVMRRPWFL
ncbi:hypothetical protein [Methylobacterium gossipiicola]|uniref:Protein argonaute n=1 Tax=Methylobacterium gossipiicola TaxID=582675 RepID=A0A1I2T6Q1_9HYPH|nr:hypothetical protein [Methylobacterium gossipiicola]SFG58206.1 Piwi domain-containing protein [Methylobacterium gossipiicola]